VSWTAPSAVVYGTALSATQLDASAPVPGTFTYTPAIGAILAVGSHNLAVTFTPADAAGYASAAGSTTLSVTPAPLVITGLSAQSKLYDGTATARLSGTAVLSGVVGSDAVSLAGTPVATFAQPDAGSSITVTVSGYTLTGAQAANYTLLEPILSASITPAPQTIKFAPISRRIHNGKPITLTARASSGLPVSFAVVSGPATVSGATLTPTGSGTIVVAASQGGDQNYQAAPVVEQSVKVNRKARRHQHKSQHRRDDDGWGHGSHHAGH
ncbi:MAG: YDG domain-containing protein, partial [Terriglobales bacterium]